MPAVDAGPAPAWDETTEGLGNVKEIALAVERTSRRSRVSNVVSDVSDDEITPHHIRLFNSAMFTNAVKSEVHGENFIGQSHPFNCSFGFIRVKPSQFRDNTWHVLPVTCKHNLQDETIGGQAYKHHAMEVATNSKVSSAKSTNLFLDKVYGDSLIDEATNRVLWKEGMEISVGQECSHHSLPATQSAYSHFCIREDFQLEVGMKIGIAVYRRENLRPDSAGLSTHREVDSIFGEAGPHLYCGNVTKVGNGYFGHDINTYKGCSGALIVLLEPSRDDVISESDTGCAIGIHSGYSDNYMANLGFSLWSSDRIKAAAPVRSDHLDTSASEQNAKRQ